MKIKHKYEFVYSTNKNAFAVKGTQMYVQDDGDDWAAYHWGAPFLVGRGKTPHSAVSSLLKGMAKARKEVGR